MTLLERIWYRQNHPFSLLMAPLGWINMLLVALRRRGYREGFFHSVALPVPVIVVGNISVGGTGKTPFVIWLVRWLKRAGYKPGVVSRGYGGKATSWPQQVRTDSAPDLVGDEPVLLARLPSDRTGAQRRMRCSTITTAIFWSPMTACSTTRWFAIWRLPSSMVTGATATVAACRPVR